MADWAAQPHATASQKRRWLCGPIRPLFLPFFPRASSSAHHLLGFSCLKQYTILPVTTMRLLNTTTLNLEYFPSKHKPQYAILSHTWGQGEIMYDDARYGGDHLRSCGKRGLDKVLKTVALARENGYDYVWIDTFCIDKSSSAELSEAINSMFSWYKYSAACYAYLEDYYHGSSDLLESRWFFRGWTLQELLAPRNVLFFDAHWTPFGDRYQLAPDIARVTGINERALRLTGFKGSRSQHCGDQHPDTSNGYRSCWSCWFSSCGNDHFADYGISTKMSWAARRETTRPEDIAYCLMGIFNVNMPLLYGEGTTKAFRRLQEEIVQTTETDQSFLLWEDDSEQPEHTIFASHPARFLRGDDYFPVVPSSTFREHPLMMTSAGIELDVYLTRCRPCRLDDPLSYVPQYWLAVLDCSLSKDYLASPALLLEKTARTEQSFKRLTGHATEYYLREPGLWPVIVSHGSSSYKLPRGRQNLSYPRILSQNFFVPRC